MENKSVFEMILSGEIDSDIIYEDEQIFAIHDINLFLIRIDFR